jgi:hypothetical protein
MCTSIEAKLLTLSSAHPSSGLSVGAESSLPGPVGPRPLSGVSNKAGGELALELEGSDGGRRVVTSGRMLLLLGGDSSRGLLVRVGE